MNSELWGLTLQLFSQFGQSTSWCQCNAKNIEKPQQEIEFGCPLRNFAEALTPELSFQWKCHRDGEQWQCHADGIACGQHTEDQVGQEEQHGVENIGEGGANEDGQGDNSRLPVRLHVPCVVAVQDGLSTEGQRDSVEQGWHRQVTNLHCMGKHDSQGPKGDQDHHVTKRNVFKSNSCGKTQE